jgi:hypothetical protein
LWLLLPPALLLGACQAYVQQQEIEHRAAVEQNHLELMVYTSDLTEPYDKLGTLGYTEPVSGESIDSDHINEKLRQLAIARWGQQVDAVILVTSKIGGADPPTISVTGEAVRINGECSGCRHSLAAPPG